MKKRVSRAFKYLGLYSVLVVVALLVVASASAQGTIEELNEQIKKAEKEIKINTELLSKTLKNQKNSQSQLKIVRSRLTNRRKIVSSLGQQIGLIEGSISTKGGEIKQLNATLERTKQEYARMIREGYKNYKLNNFTLFLFASKDFNDATRRVDFMQRYNRMRRERAKMIIELQKGIKGELTELSEQKLELDRTKGEREGELVTLAKDEKEYKTSVERLKSEEGKINRELRAKRSQIEAAQKSIERIVAEEAKRLKNQTKTEKEQREIVELTGRFDQNIGKLPYPINKGVIIDNYGEHSHPTQPGMKINNKGINIAGDRGSQVNAVFEGEVTRIFSLQGMNHCVMVRHGDYITLYANMESVAVKTGDKVLLNQRLGRIPDSANNDNNYLHFEVWKETTNLNPELWLKR